jgi:hypothetical protein
MGASYGPVGTYSYCSSIISCHSFVPCGAQCKTTGKMRRPKELLLRCTQPRTAREDHRIDADATEHPCLRCTYGTRCCNSDRRQWKRRDDVRAYVARSHPLQVHGHSTWSTPTYAHPPTTVRSTTDPSRPRLREHAQDAQGTARRGNAHGGTPAHSALPLSRGKGVGSLSPWPGAHACVTVAARRDQQRRDGGQEGIRAWRSWSHGAAPHCPPAAAGIMWLAARSWRSGCRARACSSSLGHLCVASATK